MDIELDLVTLVRDFAEYLDGTGKAAATIAGYRNDVEGLLGAVGDADIDGFDDLTLGELTPAAVKVAFDTWTGAGADARAQASRQRARSAWRSFVTYLLARKLCDSRLMDAIESQWDDDWTPRPVATGDLAGTVRRLLRTAGAARPELHSLNPIRDVALIATMVGAGARTVELVDMALIDIEQAVPTGELSLRNPSNGLNRLVPVPPGLVRRLERWIEHRGSPTAVEAAWTDNNGRAMTRRQIQGVVRHVIDGAGLAHRFDGNAIAGLTSAFTAGLAAIDTPPDQIAMLAGYRQTRKIREFARVDLARLAGHPAHVALDDAV